MYFSVNELITTRKSVCKLALASKSIYNLGLAHYSLGHPHKAYSLAQALTLIPQFIHTMKQWLAERATSPCHRQLLVIHTQQPYVDTLLTRIPALLQQQNAQSQVLCVAQESLSEQQCVKNLTKDHYKQVLGQEFEYIIYDAFAGVKPSAFLALEGCVARAGLFIVIAPPLDEWAKYEAQVRGIKFSHGDTHTHSYFTSRLLKIWQQDKDIAWMSLGLPSNEVLVDEALGLHKHSLPIAQVANISLRQSNVTRANTFTLTPEQRACFTEIQQHLMLPRSVSVLNAKRGRGKSTLLGEIAAHLVQQNKHFIFTAPSKANCKQIVAVAGNEILAHYRPPDQLHNEAPSILLVDEAAALAPELLKNAISHHHHVIMMTTIVGYEGSGLGFKHKVLPYIQGLSYPILQQTLLSPQRWWEGDSLERLFASTFVPQAKDNNESLIDNLQPSNRPRFIQLNKQDISTNNQCFNEAYALLLQAHYQTTPDDLMRMLDAQDQQVFVLEDENNQLIAATIIVHEHLDTDEHTAMAIVNKQRRLQGMLINQQLAHQLYSREALRWRNWRIGRIAVTPCAQGRGFGTCLLKHIEALAIKNGVDFLSSSFGLTPELINFWQRQQFFLAKIGLRKDTSSGLNSGIMLRDLSPRLQDKKAQILANFNIQLNYLKKFQGNDICSQLLSSANNTCQHSAIGNTRDLSARIESVVNGATTVDDQLPWIYELLRKSLEQTQLKMISDSAQISDKAAAIQSPENAHSALHEMLSSLERIHQAHLSKSEKLALRACIVNGLREFV